MGNSTSKHLRSRLPSFTVETLQEQSLIILHSGQVMPLLAWIVSNTCRLASSVWISVFDGNKIFIPQGRRAGKAKRIGLDWAIQWTPNIDNAVSSLQELLCLFREMMVYTLCGRLHGLIDMYPCYRCPGCSGSGTADGVIEDENLICSWDMI
jgi:hypothetical protein